MPTTFDLAAHDRFVKRHGDRVEWRRALLCPCGSKADANRANVNCASCGGIGYRYEAAQVLTALVTGVGGREKMLLEAGLAEPGDMVLGLSPLEPDENRLSDFDLVRLTWTKGSPYHGDLLIRGSGASDRLVYEPKRVLKVFVVDPSTGVETLYGEGTDFTVSGRAITWTSGPAIGESYSVRYDALFDWLVFSSPMQRFERGDSLGQRVLLRRRHVALPGS